MRMFIPEDDFRDIVSKGASLASVMLCGRVELSLNDNIKDALAPESFNSFDYEQVLDASPNVFGDVDYEDELRYAVLIDIDDALDACAELEDNEKNKCRHAANDFIRQYSEASLVNLYNFEPDWIEQAFRYRVNDSIFSSLSEMVYAAYDASDLPKHDIASALTNYDAWNVTGLDRMGSFESPMDALRESFRWYATHYLASAYNRATNYIHDELEGWSFVSL